MSFIAIGTVIGSRVRQNATTSTSPDLSIAPIPNWSNISNNQGDGTYRVAVQRIQGISTTITLEVTRDVSGINIYYRVDTTLPTWTNGGLWNGDKTGWTLINSFPSQFAVANNWWVSFGCEVGAASVVSSLTIINVSDSNLPLDTIVATGTRI